jgi:hypothetical protein
MIQRSTSRRSAALLKNEGLWFKNSDQEQEGDLRYGAALIVAVVGLLIPAILVFFLATRPDWKPNDVATLVGLFTGVVGTLVGAFLGVQVGAAGKEKSENLANRALAALPPERAAEVLNMR